MTRLVLIALDGATLDLLQPWMDTGKLPLLAKLFAEGAGGMLNSTVPWATPTAFASLATGTNPGKHGVYDFGTLIGEDYSAFIPTSGKNVRGKALWERLSEAGLRSLVVNMPMTYPAPPINGQVIAGIPYPGQSDQLCHPPDLLAQLREQGWDLARNASDDLGGNYADYLAGLLDLVETRGAATASLIRQDQPDFVAVHFLETDQVQHRFWQFMQGEPRYEAEGPHTDGILEIFQASEQAMQQIIDAAGPEATICIMSDHGFGPTRHQVWLNNWLMQNQFLALKPNAGVQLKRWLYRAGLSPAAIREMAPERIKLAILRFFEQQKGRALAEQHEDADSTVQRKGMLDHLTERLAIDFYDVDWSKTVAFSTGTTAVGYVYINSVEQHPQGVVSAETRTTIRDNLINALQQWDAVGQVHTREEIWSGNQLPNAPDLIVRWAADTTDARYFQTRFSSHHLMKAVPNDYASHRPNGLFTFHGPNVKQGRVDADLIDLTPTILWLFDQPVPSVMDGQVLRDCFDREAAVAFVEEDEEAMAVADGAFSAEEDAALKNVLRQLGYLE
ncbi:MAG: alkaline phosphatase family protein [Candidatus Promineifilaceae bacterium]